MRRLLASVSAAILAAGLLGTVVPVAAAVAPPTPADAPSYYPSGPQYDVPVSTLESAGWTRCFQEPYTNMSTTLVALQAACDGDYLIITGRPIDSSTLTILAAAPRADVFTVTPRNEPRLVNGTYWYYTPVSDGPAQSMGFSTDSTIRQSSCDFEDGEALEGALCWHIINDDNPTLGDGFSMDGIETYDGYIREAYELTDTDWIFKIASLSPTALYAIDTEDEIDDVEGGIGVCGENVVYRGGDGNAVYSSDDFSGGTHYYASSTDSHEMFATDIRTRQVWVFDDYTSGMGMTFDSLTELDCETGLLSDNVIPLSVPIAVDDFQDNDSLEGAVFAGYGRIVFVEPESGTVYDIDLPSGQVSTAGTLNPDTSAYFANREDNETDVLWGVAEFFEDSIHLVYPVRGDRYSDEEYTDSPDTIERINIATGETETVFTVPEGIGSSFNYYLGDDPSFVVDCSNSRWYLGHEYGDQNPWVQTDLPEVDDYNEPLIAFAAECYTSEIGTDLNCGDVDLTVCPTITEGSSGLIGAPGTSQTLNRATYTWLRCVTPGTAVPGPRPPSGCRTIRTFKATGAQMAVRPYGVTSRDAKAGYIRLAVKVGTRTYYSGAYSVAP
jgi:hypothetical protein